MFILCVGVSFTEQIHFQWHFWNINMLVCGEMVGFAEKNTAMSSQMKNQQTSGESFKMSRVSF
jgi:hypothetical protein